MNEVKSQDKKAYKAALILLVALVAFSNAMRELNRLQAFASDVRSFTNEWVADGFFSAQAKEVSPKESCESEAGMVQSPSEFRWSGRVTSGAAIEIKGVNGDITAEPATGSDVEVVAQKTARRSDTSSVEIKVVQHAGGVTICAVYPSDDPNETNTCAPGRGGRMNVSNNDVQVDFLVRVPARVGLVGRTVNGEVTATSLSGNVVSNTVNGAIKISTSGYAQATTVNGEISAKIGDVDWPDSIEFKTVNGEIELDLPASISTDVKADTFNGDISTEFPVNSSGTTTRRHLSGRIGSGGRSLILKTLNGSISLRRAG